VRLRIGHRSVYAAAALRRRVRAEIIVSAAAIPRRFGAVYEAR